MHTARLIRRLFIPLASALLAATLCAAAPLFRMTVKAVDDEGKPVAGASVRIGVEKRVDYRRESPQGKFATGQTDGDGMFSATQETHDARRSGYWVTKDGCYPVYSVYEAKEPVDGRWQPWNPTVTVVLKRIKNPVPMYVRRVETSLPVLNAPLGYDLEVGDWVAPQGKGRTADLVFVGKLEQRSRQDFDWELKVSFSNPGDGLQRFEPEPDTGGSQLRSPHEAPRDGYLSALTLTQVRRANVREKTSFKSDGGYFFRVRTVLDAQGNVIQAWYGKIYGDFFNMTYYLNPDTTRNVEFDPEKNLFHPKNARDSAFWNLGP